METKNVEVLTITDKAKEKLKALVEANEDVGDHVALRVAVIGGGCSGYQYSMSLSTEDREGDIKVETPGATIVIDKMSASLIKGTTLDYKETLQASGFVFSNPNAKRTCGCGKSFS